MKTSAILNTKTLSLIATLFFVLSAFGQQKMSDRDADGLKGQVKSVTTVREVTESKNYFKNTLGKLKSLIETYDVNGAHAQIVDYESNSKNIYTVIDGDLTSKSFQIAEEPEDRAFTTGGEMQQKPTQPADKRYNSKYKYKFDEQGRRTETFIYRNNGTIFSKNKYKFDDQGLVTERLQYDEGITLNEQDLYKYDESGSLTEMKTILHRPGKNTFYFDKYSNYKFDSGGNWIERTYTHIGDFEGKELKSVIKYTRKIEYYK